MSTIDIIAMPLDLMFGFGHGGGVFSEDWLHHEYYSYGGSLRVSLQTWSFFYGKIAKIPSPRPADFFIHKSIFLSFFVDDFFGYIFSTSFFAYHF